MIESHLAQRFAIGETLVVLFRVSDGVLLDVNAAFERQSGFARAEVIGRTPMELGVWPDDSLRAKLWDQVSHHHALPPMPVWFFTKQGERRGGQIYGELLDHQGDACLLLFIRDAAHGLGENAVDEAVWHSYRKFFLNAAEGMYRAVPNGHFIDVNPALAQLLGFQSVAEFFRDAPLPLTARYCDASEAEAFLHTLERTGVYRAQRVRWQHQTGREIWVSITARLVRNEQGVPLFVEGSVSDVTAWIEAELAMVQSEALYRTLVDHFSDGIFLLQNGQVIFINPGMTRILGYEWKEIVGRDYMDIVDQPDLESQMQRRQLRESGQGGVFDHELRLLHRDGHAVAVEVRSAPVSYGGRLASIGTVRDISKQKQAALALADAERKYRELFEHAPIGLLRTGIDGLILDANKVMVNMMGFDSADELRAHTPHIHDFYAHPGEREQLTRLVAAHGQVVGHRLLTRDRNGRLRWIELNSRATRGSNGEISFEGSVNDITDRLEMEEAFKRSEAKFRAVVEHAQVGVFVMHQGRYAYVNHAFAEMLKYKEHELVGMHFSQVAAPECLSDIEDRIRQQSPGNEFSGEYETWLVRSDGAKICVNVSSGPLLLDGVMHRAGTVRDVTERHQLERQLRFNASHDPLTGLPNRLVIESRLNEVIELSRAGSRINFALLFFDLDGFKFVNDSHGHVIGDQLLVAISKRLEAHLGPEALIARYGGDEFALFPAMPCDRMRAERLASRILALLSEPFDIDGLQVFSGASIGVVLGHPRYQRSDEVLRDADTALYRAKHLGKARYVVFDQAMHRQARNRFQLETDLRIGIERDQFEVHYQPIVHLQGEGVAGFEALVRWRHPERGLLAPAEFLSLAEDLGLISVIDWRVLEQASAQLVNWQREFGALKAARMQVNLDEAQFQDRQLVQKLRSVIERTRIVPSCLTIEVTETVFQQGRENADEVLRELKQLGVQLVIDDFGTGFSSFDGVVGAPIDGLKIDRSFTSRISGPTERGRAVVRSIARLAHELGMSSTAEGVENEAELQFLREIGCTYAQGYKFAYPMDSTQLMQWLAVRAVA